MQKTGTLLDVGYTPSDMLSIGVPLPFVMSPLSREERAMYFTNGVRKSRCGSKSENRFGNSYKKARAKARRANRKSR